MSFPSFRMGRRNDRLRRQDEQKKKSPSKAKKAESATLHALKPEARDEGPCRPQKTLSFLKTNGLVALSNIR